VRVGSIDSLVAVLTSAAVGLIVLARRERAPGSRPLTALCLVLVLWHLGDFLWWLMRVPAWRIVSALGSAALAPLLVHFVVEAAGGRFGRAVFAFYATTAAFLAATSIALFDARAYALVRSAAWVVAYFVLLVPPMVVAVAWAVRTLRSQGDPVHGARLRWWLVGATVGLAGGLSDLTALATHLVPGFGAVGTTLGLLCVAWTLDLGAATEHAVATRSSLLGLALSAIVAFATLVISAVAWRMEAVVVLGGAMSIAALAAFRVASARLQQEATRVQSLALLGTFAAEVAHEVRNPLTAIRGAVQLLQHRLDKGADPASLREYLALIDAEVERLDGVVADYHALARKGSDRVERASIARLVRDLVDLHGPLLPARVRVETDLADGLPPVRADAARLRQALLNLVRNAVAAMPEGGTLRLRAALDPTARPPAVRLDVEDTGVGIAPEDLARIFQPLYTKRTGGSGLGLAVTKRIAEEHGGSVTVRSVPGRGSTFTLLLPTEDAPSS
jgi:signal transduction histidine kinase